MFPLISSKLKLWIFPEGTRSSSENMIPFKKGAFHLAITSQLPICPVVFSRYNFLNHAEERFDPAEIVIRVLPLVPTEGMTLDDLPQLMDKVHNAMTEAYHSVNQELESRHLS